MPKIIVSIDGSPIREVALAQGRTTIGRRPYNDIVLDNLAVSGEHAVLHRDGSEVRIEDLDSTNGTYVNGKAVRSQMLHDGDRIEISRYRIMYLGQGSGDGPALQASVVMLSGVAAGREVLLEKVVTTIGKSGLAVASITRHPRGFLLSHVEGENRPVLNGSVIGAVPVPLRGGDRLDLAGTQMQFIVRSPLV